MKLTVFFTLFTKNFKKGLQIILWKDRSLRGLKQALIGTVHPFPIFPTTVWCLSVRPPTGRKEGSF